MVAQSQPRYLGSLFPIVCARQYGDGIVAKPQARLEHLTTRLREKGFRLTPQRMAVLKILARSERHPSVESIYEQVTDQFPTTSLATIYKTINVLKDMTEVLELGFGGAASRYDGTRPYPHPHLVCDRCGSIEDLDIPQLSELPQTVAARTGYLIENHRLDFFGVCPRCQERGVEKCQQQHRKGVERLC